MHLRSKCESPPIAPPPSSPCRPLRPLALNTSGFTPLVFRHLVLINDTSVYVPSFEGDRPTARVDGGRSLSSLCACVCGEEREFEKVSERTKV